MKKTAGSKRTELVKIVKHRRRVNEKGGEKIGSGKELKRKKK